MHLDIPSGTAVRFEPGEEKEVTLVEFAGKQRVFGLNNLTCGHCSDDTKNTSVDKAVKKGFIKKER
jgi:urease beta subunit